MHKNIFRISFFIVVLIFWSGTLQAQVKICSWNLQNFGKSKSAAEIQFVANTLKEFDVVALQEIVAGYGGAQAVAKLADELNRTGTNWDYIVSDPTVSTPYGTERYAYLWKTSSIKRVKRAWLEDNYVQEIDREPYLLDFNYNGELFTLVSFHAIPKKRQPETEIKYFKFFPEFYAEKNLIFLGDFNIPQSHTVFNPLKKMGYESVFKDQKTTMKMKCVAGECLASEYDNIFYDTKNSGLQASGVVHFYRNFPDMKAARRISDHIPVWAEFYFGEEKDN
ncbi:deoxyribonuclease [Salinimicrobium marinum]|uniref:Deoxyribonuclease n=1 Tax=Salinimicrobium marinum TaxID=680283 RepID=A0A918VVJ8_9FLAO|nr:endonuclease/exonuclease/phosphatase family protein [Salinimicrobium marinum]GHA27218.1 deoxyribonuclease [Salinimicrobium marinum]